MHIHPFILKALQVTQLMLLSLFLFAQNSITELVDYTDSLRGKKHYDLTLSLLQDARNSDLFTEADCAGQGKILHKLGVAYYVTGDYTTAAQIWRDTVIPIRESCDLVPTKDLANTYFVLSRAYYYSGKPFGQKEALEKSVQLLSTVPDADPHDLAVKFTFVALLFLEVEDYAKAEQYFQQAEENLKKSSKMSGTDALRLYGNWAYLATELRQHQRALGFVNKAEQIAIDNFDQTSKSYRVNAANKARVLLYAGDLDQALAYNQKAYNLDLAQGDSSAISLHQALFGAIYKRRGQYERAKEIFQKAFDQSPEPAPGAISFDRSANAENLGDVAVLEKDWEQALQQYQLAISYLLPDYNAEDLFSVPEIGVQTLNVAKDLRRVLSLQGKALRGYYKDQKDPKILAAAAKLYQALDQVAIQLLQQLSLAGSKDVLMADLVTDYESAIAVYLDLFELSKDENDLNEAYRFSAQNKALLLIAGLQNEQALNYAGLPKDILEEEAKLQGDFLRYQWLSTQEDQSKSTQAYRDSLFAISEAYRRFMNKLETEYPAYHELKYALPAVESIRDIQKDLDDKTMLIEYFVGDKEVFIFSIEQDDLQYKRLVKTPNFESDVLQLRKLMEKDQVELIDQLAVSAYQHYQLLLADFLDNQDIQRLIIIPDGPLMTIAFDALLFEPVQGRKMRNWPFLLRKMAISQLYSSRLLNRPLSIDPVKRPERYFGGFGIEYNPETLERMQDQPNATRSGIDLARDLGRLKYSDDEVIAIAELLDGDMWLNQEATLKEFLLHSADYRILHLAMHGIVNEDDPLQSALIFAADTESSEFLLRAAQLYELSLPTEMTVLSACHTAFGQLAKGEGIRSLARAFSYAGSNSLLASLWAASDQASQQIMIGFYQELKQGETRDVALQKAKLKYLEEAPSVYLHPSYWAPFTLIGERGPISKPWYQRLMWLWVVLLFGAMISVWYARRVKNRTKGLV